MTVREAFDAYDRQNADGQGFDAASQDCYMAQTIADLGGVELRHPYRLRCALTGDEPLAAAVENLREADAGFPNASFWGVSA